MKHNGWNNLKKAFTLVNYLRGDAMDILQGIAHEALISSSYYIGRNP